MQLENTAKTLERNGFAVRIFPTAKDAAAAIAGELHGKTIGFGGSVTLEQMGLFELLSKDNTVWWHWRQDPALAHRESAGAEVYFTSANAIAETGEIINIDGTGNRVAATFFGHETLYIVAGSNKIAPDLPSAMDRARNIASPLNARRLNRQTPCALSEPMRCHDCRSPERICNGFSIFPRPMRGIGKTHVILIDEALGY